MSWAYAVGELDVTKSPPVVVGVAIYGAEAGDLCLSYAGKNFLFDITKEPGETYADAARALERRLVDSTYRDNLYAWVVPLLKEFWIP